MLECKRDWLKVQHMIIDLTDDKEEPIVVYQEDWKTKEIKKLKIYLNVKNHKYGKSVCYFIVPYWNYEKCRTGVTTLQRLVYLQFKGDIPAGCDIDHIDNDSLNNLPSNLQAISRKENLSKRSGHHNHYEIINKQEK